jgi:2-oxoglutarate dehydrogenase E2 component (dihydrolipoamide succinyltransferase)
VVPVVRNADRLSLAEVERTISELGTKAKENRITLQDLEGGTFTISNGGVYGSMMSTPILNPPKAASWACTPSRSGRSPWARPSPYAP